MQWLLRGAPKVETLFLVESTSSPTAKYTVLVFFPVDDDLSIITQIMWGGIKTRNKTGGKIQIQIRTDKGQVEADVAKEIENVANGYLKIATC